MTDHDLILVGGGLANGLIAYRLRQTRPDLRVLVLESGDSFGGNHTWSFHAGDITVAQQGWTAPFVAHRWRFYTVSFPGLHRRVDLPYWCATSDRFDAELKRVAIPVRFGVTATRVEPMAVTLADGTVLGAQAVIDGRGPSPEPHLRLAWQKFVGVEIRTTHPHRLTGPVLMDATVRQEDGYRFVYVLPLDRERLLVEDTYYSASPHLDVAALRERIGSYADEHGWAVAALEREETGVLPITLGGDPDAFWAARAAQPCSGLRAGLFHPTTGYSWPDAVRLADHVATLPSLEAAPLAAAIRQHAEARWRDTGFFRLLNRMLFHAGEPGERWRILRRFYGLSEPAIGRFYAGHLAARDKLRLLAGRPPVPIGGAIRAMPDRDRAAASVPHARSAPDRARSGGTAS